jgi:hypothetical protein
MGIHRWEDVRRGSGGGDDREGVLISYDPLPDASWQARLFWQRGEPLVVTARSISEARALIRHVLVLAVGESEAATLLENGAETLPAGADDSD